MNKIHNKQLLYPLSGSFTGSFEGTTTTASYALHVSGGEQYFIPVWTDNNTTYLDNLNILVDYLCIL